MRKPNEKPINILLTDDDEDDYLITKHVFAKIPDSPFVLEWCPSFEKARRLIAGGSHDIYLLDYRLGEHTGLELLKFAEPGKRREPFILLTGTGDHHVEKQAMKLGASDYLIKGSFDAELLSRTLNYALGRKEAEEQRLQQLIELNQAKDEFISVASHQLRTPATGVKQYIGMLLEGIIDEPTESQRAILRKAYESNERQLRIVSDLLKVARVDAGKVMLRKAATDLNQLLADVVKEQAEIAKSRRQRIEFICSDDPANADVDRDTVRMVFENLVDNASKYSGEDTVIRVCVKVEKSMVTVAVSDEGVGIDPSDQGKLFAKFSRIHNPLSAQVGGSGLGLYWAKKIIDLHGGTIEVKSKVDNGTTFEVGLPKSA
jgi:two-component system sensor histidine kinase/response regulator